MRTSPDPARRRAPVLVVAVLLALAAGCTSGGDPAPVVAAPSTTDPGTTTPGTTTPSPTAGPTAPAPSSSGPATASPVTSDPAAGPEFLCQGAEQPRDTADAYTGALSAGSLDQALACVYPGTVPEATSRQLLVAGTQGSAYVLDEAASTGTTFLYQGPSGPVQVTVTEQADGHDWVTGVRVG